MRFEVRYPTGEPHQVELQGTFAVLGRDPSCDLVLNDVKCSRRHAVLEAGPDGLAIRDTESANGVFVNGHKVERAKLNEGDVVRLGEVVLRVLPEQITGTVVMGPEDLVDLVPSAQRVPSAPARSPLPPTALDVEPPAALAPHRPSSAAAPRRSPARPLPARPLTIQVLCALWLASVLLYGGAGALLALRGNLPAPFGLVAAVGGGVLALFSAVLAFGLWTLRPWARFLQIAVAAIGILACPMTLASATVLVYMFRKPTAQWFSGRDPGGSAPDDPAAMDRSAEATFSLTVLAMVALGILLLAGGLYVGWQQR